jgi:hypothetical protein
MENSKDGAVGSGRFKIVHPVSTGDLREQPFTDAVILNADIFKVAEQPTDSLYAICKSVKDALICNRVTSRTASNMLILPITTGNPPLKQSCSRMQRHGSPLPKLTLSTSSMQSVCLYRGMMILDRLRPWTTCSQGGRRFNCYRG